jgi:hypothetical protein
MAALIHNMIHHTDKLLKYKDVTQPHNLKVVGSNPTPATNTKARNANALAGFFARQFAQLAPP